MCTIIHILVLSLLKKELFFFKKRKKYCFHLNPYVEFKAIEFSLI
jgi:hypothetical protein